ncbi:MAG: marine proteobacterial sortase target protein [Nitrospira sp.]|nr:marine proteobacterial sortase target protein [Nitrospira sp.]
MRKLLGSGLIVSIVMMFVYQCHPMSVQQEAEARKVRFQDIQEGTLVKKTPEEGIYEVIPRLETSVKMKVEGMVISTTVDQVFENTSEAALEAVYVFPLPEDAAVYSMEILINDRLIKGEVKEKQEARVIYDQAKQEGKRASLTEQERPNIFTNSVANIMPGDRLMVRLKYVSTAEYKDGEFSLRFPMTVAPRYIPGSKAEGYTGSGTSWDTDAVADASRITPPVRPGHVRNGEGLFLELELDAKLPIESVQSVSHSIKTTVKDDNTWQIGMSGGKVIPNKDFVLTYRIKSGSEPKAALYTSEKDGQQYFMLMVLPEQAAMQEHVISREMIFILDKSGSMDGDSMKQAKGSLLAALMRLRPDDYFNIITFNDEYQMMEPVSVRADAENIGLAGQLLMALEADGGTEAQPALKAALDMPARPESLKIIVFITDGSVGNEEELISLVSRNIGTSRLFGIGIGSAPNSFLMNKVTRAGRGTFTYISDADEVQQKMSSLFAKIENPALLDLQLQLDSGSDIMPDPLPDLFQGEPLLVFGKLDGLAGGRARLTGIRGGRSFVAELPFDPLIADSHSAISMLWARNKIAALMDEYYLGNEELKPEVISLAVEHGLITQFTSFVAVEHKIVNPGGDVLLSAIPTELPEGWSIDKVKSAAKLKQLPQTASSKPLTAAAGLIIIVSGLLLWLTDLRKRALLIGSVVKR